MLYAMMRGLLSVDHAQLTCNHFGRDLRRTDVHRSVA
ncbi:hypothetical protein CA12_03540 [Alienimonas californiensis]|uniref:Uncharacterized protein n=1 Tax=Alienimonas californiensis TaxID=2527989 RepID=A0A517P4J2_9PLAN|nr:hypothetical protein CA12_03540 [Alienimonas californiensis]